MEDRPVMDPPGGPSPAPGSKPLVDRARAIILDPKAEWPRIDAEPATIGGIYKSYVMPLAAIAPVAHVIGMLVFGISFLGVAYRPALGGVIGYAVVLYILSLVSIYVLALIIDALAPSFDGTKDQLKAFKVAAYSWTAAWLAGIFNIIPNLSWLALVGVYSLYLLYLGLPRLMRAPESKALGYTVVVIIAAILLWIVVGGLTAALVGPVVRGPAIL
jgi:hypothetical protein